MKRMTQVQFCTMLVFAILSLNSEIRFTSCNFTWKRWPHSELCILVTTLFFAGQAWLAMCIHILHCTKIWLWPSLIRIKGVTKLHYYLWQANQRCWSTFDIIFETTLTRIKDASPLTRSKCHQRYLWRTFESNFAIALIQVKGILHLTEIKYGLWLVSKVVKGLCKDGLYHLRHMSKVSGKGEFSYSVF